MYALSNGAGPSCNLRGSRWLPMHRLMQWLPWSAWPARGRGASLRIHDDDSIDNNLKFNFGVACMLISQSVLLIFLFAFGMRLWSVERRLKAVESLLMRVSRHVGVLPPLATEPSQRIRELARSPGKRVAAIRAVREEMGLDLRAARAVVRSLANHKPR